MCVTMLQIPGCTVDGMVVLRIFGLLGEPCECEEQCLSGSLANGLDRGVFLPSDVIVACPRMGEPSAVRHKAEYWSFQ